MYLCYSIFSMVVGKTESMYRTCKVGQPERRARPDFAPRAAKRACRTLAALPQSEVPHRRTPDGTCRADAARQKERERTRGCCGHWRVRCRLLHPRGRCWYGSYDGGQRVPGRREDPPRHREHNQEESRYVSSFFSFFHIFPFSHLIVYESKPVKFRQTEFSM